MAKRSSDGESLHHSVVKTIGRLTFNRNDHLGGGSFGKVYKGKFKEFDGQPEIDVAIKRIERSDFKKMEEVVIKSIQSHPNVLRYYCTEIDDDFM